MVVLDIVSCGDNINGNDSNGDDDKVTLKQ